MSAQPKGMATEKLFLQSAAGRAAGPSGGTVQAEALPPATLNALIRDAHAEKFDFSEHGARKAAFEDGMAMIRGGWGEVAPGSATESGSEIGECSMTRRKADEKPDAHTIVVTEAKQGKGEFKPLGGSQSDQWNHALANQAIRSLWMSNSDESEQALQMDATIAAMVGIDPKDELEGMMGAQLLAAHNAAMECYRRAMIGEQTFEGRKENLNQANKLSRTWTMLLNALDKHRGKGQQKVIVEHVHVHQGGQAIVGNVEHPGGGARGKTKEQPHAKQVAHAPEPALRSADEAREPVSVTSDAQR